MSFQRSHKEGVQVQGVSGNGDTDHSPESRVSDKERFVKIIAGTGSRV